MSSAAKRQSPPGGRARFFALAFAAACLTFGGAPTDAPVTGTRFVAFGDSLTAGYGNPGMPWPVELASMRPDLSLVRNSGVAGNTTRDMLRRIGSDVYAYDPDLVLIFAGINDLSACESVEEIVGNVDTMVTGLRARGTERVVVILNSHSVVLPDGPSCVPTTQSNIDRLDDALAAYAQARGIQTIDLRPVLDTDGAFSPEYFLADGIHYNATGVHLVSAAIRDQLPAMPPSASAQPSR